MKNFDFPAQFRALYDQAVDLYAKGRRGAGSFFDPTQTAWLAANGLTPQHLYDYAEDANNDEEPGLRARADDRDRPARLLPQCPRRQGIGGHPRRVEASVKDRQAKGIEWLPRIIPKAKAKLKGELPASLMYCCGGDRRFFKTHDILPAEFLSLIWRNGDNDGATIDWVVARRKAGA